MEQVNMYYMLYVLVAILAFLVDLIVIDKMVEDNKIKAVYQGFALFMSIIWPVTLVIVVGLFIAKWMGVDVRTVVFNIAR